jgi:hypothetical protein
MRSPNCQRVSLVTVKSDNLLLLSNGFVNMSPQQRIHATTKRAFGRGEFYAVRVVSHTQYAVE